VEGVKLFTPKPVSEDLMNEVHTREMLEAQRKMWYFEGARLTVGGCVQASNMVWREELSNAVVFNVASGHHAGKSRAWGGTYLSCIGPVVRELRRNGARKLTYIDTDSHHGDGARDILREDASVLHICFCSAARREGSKVCINAGFKTSDEQYLEKVDRSMEMARDFGPEVIIHFFGHDTHKDDYGSRGLSENFFIQLAEKMKGYAGEICSRKYILIDGGGANQEVTEYIFPRIIKLLSKE
jgi:acetoin utilization deacetylase AcuC-like enzyme